MARPTPKPAEPQSAPALYPQGHGGLNPMRSVSERPWPERPSPEQIARRAYEIFEARGRTSGREVEDWLQAERELTLGMRR